MVLLITCAALCALHGIQLTAATPAAPVVVKIGKHSVILAVSGGSAFRVSVRDPQRADEENGLDTAPLPTLLASPAAADAEYNITRSSTSVGLVRSHLGQHADKPSAPSSRGFHKLSSPSAPHQTLW
jgi:hypothetical protein